MKKFDVKVSRTIPATPDQVYDVWLDSKSPGGPWFGNKRVILNPVVDGLFYHCVEHAGREWAHYGRFVALDKPRRIEHTWMSEATHGIESTVTVTLEPRGKTTEVTIHHTDLPDDEMGRGHEAGWKFVLGAIAERLTR